MAYPIRDELLAKRSELSRKGIDEATTKEAAAWSGVAVLKRLHRILTRNGYDLTKVKPLVASLRVYGRDAYPGLPSPVPDVTEVIGTSIITLFPNVRHSFDEIAKVELLPDQIDSPVPDLVFDVLSHSEISKQAYYVRDKDWVDQDDERFQPQRELKLDDELQVESWLPFKDTIAEFCRSFDAFVERIENRRKMSVPVAGGGARP